MLTDDDKRWIEHLIDERLERVETRLLRAFRQYAHPIESRIRATTITERAVMQRLNLLEDRVALLEESSQEGPEPGDVTP